MASPVYVYGLSRFAGSPIRYVGKSSKPTIRLAAHMSSRAAKRVRAWLESLPGDPSLVILQECSSDGEALLAEARWITKLRGEGCDLLNRGTVRPEPRALPQWNGFGSRVRALRMECGMSGTALAEQCGIWRPNLSRMEHGLTPNVTAETAVRLARVLGTTVEFLVTGETASDERAA